MPSSWTSAIWSVQGTDEIHRLQNEEVGLVYVDGHGFWRLEDRSHRSGAPHSAPLETIKDTDDEVNPYFFDLAWDDGDGNIENLVFMRIGDATDNGARAVWPLTKKPCFSASETKDFLDESKSDEAMTGLTTPVENTDYDANTAQNGSGTDISSELRVTQPNTSDYHSKGTAIRVTFWCHSGLPDAPQAAEHRGIYVRRPGAPARRRRDQ